MEFATWTLVFLTAVLAGATIILAVATWKYANYTERMVEGGEKQIAAFGELTKAIEGLKELRDSLNDLGIAVKNIPSTFRALETAREFEEQKMKERGTQQRRALRGR